MLDLVTMQVPDLVQVLTLEQDRNLRLEVELVFGPGLFPMVLMEERDVPQSVAHVRQADAVEEHRVLDFAQARDPTNAVSLEELLEVRPMECLETRQARREVERDVPQSVARVRQADAVEEHRVLDFAQARDPTNVAFPRHLHVQDLWHQIGIFHRECLARHVLLNRPG